MVSSSAVASQTYYGAAENELNKTQLIDVFRKF